MDERLRFVAQLLDGEPMTEVCRTFGISRKTGYKSLAAKAMWPGAVRSGLGRRVMADARRPVLFSRR